jgi:hypothetical protein
VYFMMIIYFSKESFFVVFIPLSSRIEMFLGINNSFEN